VLIAPAEPPIGAPPVAAPALPPTPIPPALPPASSPAQLAQTSAMAAASVEKSQVRMRRDSSPSGARAGSGAVSPYGRALLQPGEAQNLLLDPNVPIRRYSMLENRNP
jgi:hypothetical protein